MSLFFSADTHFSHRMMAARRGFVSPTEMNEAIVATWNHLIAPTDEVWHLGDFSFANPKVTKELVARLHGRKNLVPGNHDSRQTLQVLAAAGVEVHPPIVRRHFPGTTQKVVLCHYPLLTWPSAHYGALHLHGHSHGNLGPEESTRTDVGWDAAWGRAPIRWDYIFAATQSREYRPVDHHRPRGAEYGGSK